MRTALRAFVGTVVVGALVATVAYRSRASDHDDYSPGANEPATDIADVFAFMKPNPLADGGAGVSDRLVLMMTVHPRASKSSEFDAYGDYVFVIQGAAEPPAVGVDKTIDVTLGCRFQAKTDGGQQPFVCSSNGFFFAGETNVVSGVEDGPLRVYAGLRADPTAGALRGVVAALDAGVLSEGGTNDFAGANVLAIVAEVDVTRVVFGDASRRTLAIAATTGAFK